MFSLSVRCEESIDVDYFKKNTSPQCGCWYYVPVDMKNKGNLIAIGRAIDNSIELVLDGEKIAIGNWYSVSQDDIDYVSYHDGNYSLNIKSTMLHSGKHSSQFNSRLSIKKGANTATIEAFGECGC